jgi:3-dehydroquinate synthase
MNKIQTIHQQVTVRFDYPVLFTKSIFSLSNRTFVDTLSTDRHSRFLCVIDSNVAATHPTLIADLEAYVAHYADTLTLAAPPIIVEGGEAVKNDIRHVQTIVDAVNDYGIDRHSYIVVIGGGAVIDMVGYAAATAHRGIRLVRMPTTVLAQNDAAVGVKNSINAYGKKNFIGTFAPPYAVINDSDFLLTLSDRDWMAGVSEAVKVALLKDAQFFDYIEKHAADLVARNMEAMEWVVYRCAQLHLEHIATSGDPFEMGSSRPLDFGHWAAHKLEQLSHYEVRHGEAVAVGIALDSAYSYRMGMLSEADLKRIIDVFQALEMRIYVPELDACDAKGVRHVFNGLIEFREHLGGVLTIMLLSSVGRGVEVHEIDTDVMAKAIAYLKERETSQVEMVG